MASAYEICHMGSLADGGHLLLSGRRRHHDGGFFLRDGAWHFGLVDTELSHLLRHRLPDSDSGSLVWKKSFLPLFLLDGSVYDAWHKAAAISPPSGITYSGKKTGTVRFLREMRESLPHEHCHFGGSSKRPNRKQRVHSVRRLY